jgi:hypothetical protein
MRELNPPNSDVKDRRVNRFTNAVKVFKCVLDLNQRLLASATPLATEVTHLKPLRITGAGLYNAVPVLIAPKGHARTIRKLKRRKALCESYRCKSAPRGR